MSESVAEAEAAAPAARMDQVQKGKNFLIHPNVQSTPMNERRAFLENKGLTALEINLAVEEAGKVLPSHQHQHALTETVPTAIAAMLPWYAYVPSVAGLVGAGALLHYLWSSHYQNQEKENQITKMIERQESVEELLKKTLANNPPPSVILSAQESRSLLLKYDAMQKSVDDLKAEVRSLRVVLGAKKTFKDSTSTTTIDDDDNNENDAMLNTSEPESEIVADKWKRYREMEESLQNLVRAVKKNSDLKESIGMLKMYVKNLVDHPDTPRYRRISTVNKNYKLKMESLPEHVAFLLSIGFVKKGKNFEWLDTKTENSEIMALLRASLEALELLMNNSHGNISEEELSSRISEVSKNSMQVFYNNKNEAKPLADEFTTKSENSNDLESFISRLQPNLEEEKEKQQAEYPADFTQVATMIQNGEPIPGIQKIEEKLSTIASNPKESTMSPRLKPWEKPAVANSAEEHVISQTQ